MTEFALDEGTKQYIAELNTQANAAAQPFIQRIQAALELTVRLAKLEGEWAISTDGTKLVRQDTTQSQAEFTKKSTRRK